MPSRLPTGQTVQISWREWNRLLDDNGALRVALRSARAALRVAPEQDDYAATCARHCLRQFSETGIDAMMDRPTHRPEDPS